MRCGGVDGRNFADETGGGFHRGGVNEKQRHPERERTL